MKIIENLEIYKRLAKKFENKMESGKIR